MAVTGIGGLFFRANDPAGLQAWYKTHLGVGSEGYSPWMQSGGPTLFMPFDSGTDYFSANKGWMLNLRVDALDPLIVSLREAGIEVKTDPAWDTPETGRFARVHDPEGNPIELWELPRQI
ncbi:VOC family protein [Sphingomonas sp. RS6]